MAQPSQLLSWTRADTAGDSSWGKRWRQRESCLHWSRRNKTEARWFPSRWLGHGNQGQLNELCSARLPEGSSSERKIFKTDNFSSGSELLKNLTVPRRSGKGRKNSPESWVSSYSLLGAFYSILEGTDRKNKVCCDAAYLASSENTVVIVAWTAELDKLSVLSWCS